MYYMYIKMIWQKLKIMLLVLLGVQKEKTPVFTPKLKPAKTKTAKTTKKRIKGKDNKLNK